MQYPKPLMSIPELSAMGYPERDLRDLVHVSGFPARRLKKRGKWLIETARLDPWLEKRGLKKKDVTPASKDIQ